MKYTILIIILCIVSSCYSQNNTAESNLSIELNYSPNYNYRALTADSNRQWIVDLRDSIEKASYGFNFGLALNIS